MEKNQRFSVVPNFSIKYHLFQPPKLKTEGGDAFLVG